jgi:hypothetical protein
MNQPQPIILPMREYALPIYQSWDAKGIPCPACPEGWVASLDLPKDLT